MKTILMLATGLTLLSLRVKAETLDQAMINTEHAIQRNFDTHTQVMKEQEAREAREEVATRKVMQRDV